MADRLALAVRKRVERLIPRHATVLVAVSGGGDSVALLHLLHRLSAGHPMKLAVGHLDHGLRRGSGADLRFVREMAGSMALPVISGRRPVEPLRSRTESPSEAARRVRRRFLLDAMERTGATRIATGHTLSDQAETVLMRLLRGAGPTGLAGMRESGPGPFVRPLLGIPRGELEDWLGRNGIPFRQDPSNRNLRYDRNRVRLKVLPFLEENVNPAAADHLVRAADLLREDAAYLDRAAERRFRTICSGGQGKGVRLLAGRLAATAPPVARRVAVLALRAAGVPERRIGVKQVQALLDLDAGGSGRQVHLAGGVRAGRTRACLRIAGPEKEQA